MAMEVMEVHGQESSDWQCQQDKIQVGGGGGATRDNNNQTIPAEQEEMSSHHIIYLSSVVPLFHYSSSIQQFTVPSRINFDFHGSIGEEEDRVENYG